MQTEETTRERVFTLELENGVRVGVDMVGVNAIYETRLDPPKRVRIRNELLTCGGQPVIPDRDDPYIAVIITNLGNVVGRIVDRGVLLSDVGILRPINSEP